MIGSHLLHAVAWVALRASSPRTAYAFVRRAGSLLPRLDEESALKVGRRLRSGSCLTRALTVSSRLPGSTVAIGVERKPGFRAHAWVEVAGRPLDPAEAMTMTIARFA